MKRIISMLLLAAMLASVCAFTAFADDKITLYVKTKTGGTLNMREGPSSIYKVVVEIPYGEPVNLISAGYDDWYEISWKGHFGYAYSAYLVSSKPTSGSKADKEKAAADDNKKALEALNREMKTLAPVAEPYTVTVRPARTSGWVNFRVGPGTGASRISTMHLGNELTVIGQTTNWYQATDPATGRTGFISKKYCEIKPKPIVMNTTVAPDTKQQIGSLNVNGKFTLQCRVPDGYTMQVVNMKGSKLIASFKAADPVKPVLFLSISFNEAYSGVERLNDMSEAELAYLEQSFTDMNEVQISYKETAFGTKLMVAREVGADTDFVDILTVYKGYSIEFVMTPSPDLANAVLTDDQVQMCVDFLSDLDFLPAA